MLELDTIENTSIEKEIVKALIKPTYSGDVDKIKEAVVMMELMAGVDCPAADKAIKQKLIAIINSERISHAQLFLGKEGSGNLAMALAYVQYLYCLNKTENDACGTCSSCVKVNKLVHPDIHFVFPVATNDKVKKDPVSNNFIESWSCLLYTSPSPRDRG